jgi:hypothetical protein
VQHVWERWKCINILVGKPERGDRWEDLGVDGKIIE